MHLSVSKNLPELEDEDMESSIVSVSDSQLQVRALMHEHKARKSVLYFALSATDSLDLDPFNQPALEAFACSANVFSISLPFHDEPYQKEDAMQNWSKEIHQQGASFIKQMIDDIESTITLLSNKGLIELQTTSVMGLSRGGFIAAHIAARFPEISKVLLFAPLSTTSHLKEYADLSSTLSPFDLHHLAPQLVNKQVRAYIGNNDERVGMLECCNLIHAIAQSAKKQHKREFPYELIITPSIGYMGHGTSKDVFEKGAQWL